MLKRSVAIVATLLVACDHGSPFRPGDYGTDEPLTPPPLVHLTRNPGSDRAPVWTADGTEILYTAQRIDRADVDHCFAVLPAGGGTISRYACRTTAPDDSVNVFEEAAVASDGRLAYVRFSTHRFPFTPVTPDAHALVLATLDRPDDFRVLQTVPYSLPSAVPHQGITHLHWLGPTRLVYLAQRIVYPRACSSCAPDTVGTGIEIVTLDVSGTTPVLAIVPGTDSASSLAIDATGDTLYFTRNGDSRVYRRVFSSGQSDTVYDFGVAGIARDVSVRNGRLAAIVGGAVSYGVDPVLGPVQTDGGGELHIVTLATGEETVLGSAVTLYRGAVFSADGTRIAVENWSSGTPDLWVVTTP